MTSRSDPRGLGGQSGFTLFELLIVLAIVALAVGLIIGRGPLGARTLAIQAAASALASDLRAARAEAILRNRPVTVTIDVARHLWIASDGKPRSFPRDLTVRATTVAGQVQAHKASIRFEPDGSCSGGSIVLADGTRHWRVGVDWLSARVSVTDAL